MGWREEVLADVSRTKESSYKGFALTEKDKNSFLQQLAKNIDRRKAEIISANRGDIAAASESGCSRAFIDRLMLDEKRISGMINSVLKVSRLPDPVGRKTWENRHENGMLIERISTPIGVIAIIYESRPDVTVEAGILCLKAGNAVILRGGKEAKDSNMLLTDIMKSTLHEVSLPGDLINLVTAGGREAVKYLLSLNNFIDLVIPRGGESLIRAVVEHSHIPVIKHYKGVCHVYVDKYAEIQMAMDIAYNAKTQRPATCNAAESLLVHKDIAERFLPGMIAMFRDAGVEIRGCENTRKFHKDILPASEDDWAEEYLDLIISVKIVDSLQDAIRHINSYGSLHSESIVTEDKRRAERFLLDVDAAAVYHNASTRFTDGGEFGLGAEIGISTDKIHARGPMGLEELTTYKYIIHGNGQVRG